MQEGTRGYVILTYKFHREGKRWVAICEELGTSTFGRSLPEAENRLDSAVALHLETLEEVGELEHFFKEHNIGFYAGKPPEETNVRVSTREHVFFRSRILPLQELTPA